MNARGFTLIEVLTALVVFALLVAMLYAVITPAGEGFARLKQVRGEDERRLGAGWRIRQDVACLVRPAGGKVEPLIVRNDNRGADAFDELWLIAATAERAGLSRIHYFVDEEAHELVRESAPLDARSGHAPLRMRLGPAESLDIQLLDDAGHWHQRWQNKAAWPRAIRMVVKHQRIRRRWLLPIVQGHPL